MAKKTMMDFDAVMEFARAYTGLGDAVQGQLDDILNGDFSEANESAVKLIRDRLEHLSVDVNLACADYFEWHREVKE